MPKANQQNNPQTSHGSQGTPIQTYQPENQAPSKEDVKNLQMMLMQTSQASKEKDLQLAKHQEELEQLKRKLIEKSDKKEENETHQEAAKRRLAIFPAEDVKNSLKIITMIAADVKKQIPKSVTDAMEAMRGNRWPSGLRQVCIIYNTEGCPLHFTHFIKGEKSAKMHLCAVCLINFEVGMSHPAHSCPVLQIIDKDINDMNMKMQISNA